MCFCVGCQPSITNVPYSLVQLLITVRRTTVKGPTMSCKTWTTIWRETLKQYLFLPTNYIKRQSKGLFKSTAHEQLACSLIPPCRFKNGMDCLQTHSIGFAEWPVLAKLKTDGSIRGYDLVCISI